VHNTIYPGAHVRRTLGDIGKYEKELFPTPVHVKGAVCCITMMKKGLGKKR
jgi:hypothetical protein